MKKYFTITEYSELQQISKQAVSNQIKSGKVESVILEYKGHDRQFVIAEADENMTTNYDKYLSNKDNFAKLVVKNGNDKQPIQAIVPSEVLSAVAVYEGQLAQKDKQIEEKDRQIAEKDLQIAALLEAQKQLIAQLADVPRQPDVQTPGQEKTYTFAERLQILFTGKA